LRPSWRHWSSAKADLRPWPTRGDDAAHEAPVNDSTVGFTPDSTHDYPASLVQRDESCIKERSIALSSDLKLEHW
jgi:hypothetical protein